MYYCHYDFYYFQKDLPLLPADRSDFDVHGALLDDKVQNKMSYPVVYYVLSKATIVLSIITIITVIYIILEQQISHDIYPFFKYTLHCSRGLAVSIPGIGRVDLCSSPMGGSNLTRKNRHKAIFFLVLYYTHYTFYARYFTGRSSP